MPCQVSTGISIVHPSKPTLVPPDPPPAHSATCAGFPFEVSFRPTRPVFPRDGSSPISLDPTIATKLRIRIRSVLPLLLLRKVASSHRPRPSHRRRPSQPLPPPTRILRPDVLELLARLPLGRKQRNSSTAFCSAGRGGAWHPAPAPDPFPVDRVGPVEARHRSSASCS